MKIDTTQILITAKTYQQNREMKGWDKTSDQIEVYESMTNAGLSTPYSVAGTFIGAKNGKIFVLDIGRKKIEMGIYDDFAGYVASKTRIEPAGGWEKIAEYNFFGGPIE